MDALSAPLQLGGAQVSVSVSVGLATATALVDAGLDARELLRRADTAMYAAKGKGKATWVAYDPQRHSEQTHEVLLPR